MRETKGAMNEIRSLDDPETRKRFEASLSRLQKETRPLIEAARASERLSQNDLAIRINTRL